MSDTKTNREAHVDDVLDRLTTLADRPWDARQEDRPPSPDPPRSPAQRLRGLAPEGAVAVTDGLLDLGGPWWRRGRIGRLASRWLPGPGSSTQQWDPVSPDAPVPRRRFPIALVVGLVVVGAVVAALLTLSSGPAPEVAPSLPVAAAAAASPSPSRAPDVVVDVVGKVTSPGLYTISDGSRVADVLRAAGGVVPGTDVTALNLARRLVDGEQIHVGIPVPPAAAAQAEAQPGPLDLNSATVAQLDTLPGVGAVTARRIVDWRSAHGRFSKVEQLREVDGIGPARFSTLSPLVVVR